MGVSDLHYAAIAVMNVPTPQQFLYCSDLLWRAHVADKYVKRLRRIHPEFGDGSLRAVAVKQSFQHRPVHLGRDYMQAMLVVVTALGGVPMANVRECERARVCMTRNKG